MMWVADSAPIRSMVLHIDEGIEQLVVTQDNGVFSWRTSVGFRVFGSRVGVNHGRFVGVG